MVLTYVKDERANLNCLTTTLIYIVTYITFESLQLPQLVVGFCFGHVMSKTCQYATNEAKVGVGMKEVNLKDAQATLHKTITRIKKYGKGKIEWQKACYETSM